MTEEAQETKSNQTGIEFEFKKIKFDRVFGHISALDHRVSIAVAMDALLLGIIVTLILAVLEKTIPYFLFSCVPTICLLILPLLSILSSMIIDLVILFRKIDYPFPSKNLKNKHYANIWLEEYVDKAVAEIRKRQKMWFRSLTLILATVILFTIIVILIIINS